VGHGWRGSISISMAALRRFLLILLVVLIAIPILADRTKLKPEFNIFSIAQDVELGRKLSKDIEAGTETLQSPGAMEYLNSLGRRLAAKAPGGGQFRFEFKIVNDRSINAMGLPGGNVYVNRGTIEAAENEAQLAGVIAHEIGHVVLRHGTHQISNAYIQEVPLSTVGATGSKSVTAVLAKIGGGFAASSIVLRNPLEAENQADLLGTQIIYDVGYDPAAAAKFFEKLDIKSDGPKIAFIGAHPSPANRIDNVTREIKKLGAIPSNAIVDSREYQKVKQLVSDLPEPKGAPVPHRD
jgi:predicted Zn-dependent protease